VSGRQFFFLKQTIHRKNAPSLLMTMTSMIMMRVPLLLLLQSLLVLILVGVTLLQQPARAAAAAQQECEATEGGGGGTCAGGATSTIGSSAGSTKSSSRPPPRYPCEEGDFPASLCGVPASLYDAGGTAVAYTPHAPESSTVCDAAKYQEHAYKVAQWPFYRSQRGGGAPKVSLTVSLLGCDNVSLSSSAKGSGAENEPQCCCHALLVPPPNGATVLAEVQVWQARPDGTYSSLRHHTSGDCRARQQRNITAAAATATTSSSEITFDTVAPGSVGSLGGLAGDSGSMYDLPPYGPPVVHILARATGHAPVLVDVPVSTAMADDGDFSNNSLFWDLRGAAWVRGRRRQDEPPRYRITSAAWGRNHGDDDDDRVLEINVEIRLPRYNEEAAAASTVALSEQRQLCPSLVYGLPSSFFLEPIAVCAPSMLNFFDL